MTTIESTLIAVTAFFMGTAVGVIMAMHSVYKDCQEFGGAKLYSGAYISCTVEVLKP